MALRLMIAVLMTAGICVHSACAGRTVTGEKGIENAENSRVRELVNKIENINSNSSKAFTASFVVDGRMGNNKKFKTLGDLVFNGNLKKLKITFIDSVFRSPMTVLLQEDRALKFYLPVDKKLYLDNADTINLKNYVNISIDYGFLSSLATGQIPLIKDYSIKQGVLHQDEKSGAGKEYYVILENPALYETISIKNDIPSKILLINRSTKNKMEFYLENPVRINNVLYYKSIRFISLQSGDRISVVFSSLNVNPRIKADRDLILTVPKNTEIIRFQ